MCYSGYIHPFTGAVQPQALHWFFTPPVGQFIMTALDQQAPAHVQGTQQLPRAGGKSPT